MPDLTGANWHTSTRSGENGDCVEVADKLPNAAGFVAVRDSKHRCGAVITFTENAWETFIIGAKTGSFDR